MSIPLAVHIGLVVSYLHFVLSCIEGFRFRHDYCLLTLQATVDCGTGLRGGFAGWTSDRMPSA